MPIIMTKITNAILLECIKEHKNVLFGAFSNQLSHQDKEKSWKKVLDVSKSVGHILLENKDNDWTYLRDTFWQNHKKRAMLKIGPKTGSAGGKNCKLTAIDELVLDIIGRRSPIVQGLGLQNSLGHTHASVLECTNESVVVHSNSTFNDEKLGQSNSPADTDINLINNLPNDNVKNIDKSKKRMVVVSSSKQCNDMDVITALKRRKLELQVEWLVEKQNYKETLEILQLEKNVLLEHSKYTLDLGLENNTDELNN